MQVYSAESTWSIFNFSTCSWKFLMWSMNATTRSAAMGPTAWSHLKLRKSRNVSTPFHGAEEKPGCKLTDVVNANHVVGWRRGWYHGWRWWQRRRHACGDVRVTWSHGGSPCVVRLGPEQHGNVGGKISGCGASQEVTTESVSSHHALSWVRDATRLNSCKDKLKNWFFCHFLILLINLNLIFSS